jgi:hypothetical protein
MYCGHAIPENHRLTKAEKDLLKSKKEQQAVEQKAAHEMYMAKQKHVARNTGVDIAGFGLGDDSNCGGDGCGD